MSKIDKAYYKINNVSFDKSTNTILIDYKKVHEYNKIERYVTQNYEKYPIYSDIKINEKKLSKSIKATSRVLESTTCFGEIQSLGVQIIHEIEDEIPYIPSWYITEASNKYNNIISNASSELESCKHHIEYCDKQITFYKSKKEFYENEHILTSKIRFIKRFRFKRKINECNNNVILFSSKMNTATSKIPLYEEKIKEATRCLNNLKWCNVKNSNYYSVNSNLENLGFHTIRYFLDSNTEDFKGCYIIENTENHKVYVGQSKNVIRRIKQHFDSTTFKPKNPIFAEDYFTSKIEEKEKLFVVKTIKCETKDELDKTEKDLIEKYDSFKSGYNSTQGNT